MKIWPFLWLFCCPTWVWGQLQRWQPPVEDASGRLLPLAWAGGLNNPQLSNIDLDGDGVLDLFIFDRSGNIVLPFRHGGEVDSLDYAFAPMYQAMFPPLERWALLRDYNCDQLPDLFAFRRNDLTGQTGIGVWRTSRQGTRLQYDLVADLLLFTTPGLPTALNLYVSNIDIPAIDDIDGDGDLDVLTFNTGGGYVELYRNLSVENGWGCDSLRFRLADNCWGRFYESGMTEAISLSPRVDSCAGYRNWSPIQRHNRHAGSTLLTWDLDGDLDKDLILGDLSFNNLSLLRNGGNRTTAFVTGQDTFFPQPQPVNIEFFPAAFAVDLNNDGRRDLLAASNAEEGSENRSLWYYQNSQSNNQPSFSLRQTDALLSDMLDFGSTAAPAAADLDGDGDLDILVGNYGFYRGSGGYESRLSLLLNIGTPQQPRFALQAADPCPALTAANIRRLVPSLGDIDGDGDADLLLGQEDGSLILIPNQGTRQNPVWGNPQYQYFGIDVGLHSAPQWIDLDGDGDLDLVVGERNGNTNYFENTGSPQQAQYSSQAQSQTLGFVDMRPPGSIEGNSAPHFVYWRGAWRLLMGSETGSVLRFEGIEQNLLGAYTFMPSPADSLDEGRQSILCTGDFNADGRLDLVVGNKRGGLAFWSWDLDSLPPLSLNRLPGPLPLRCYPNPSSGEISLDWQGAQPLLRDLSLELYNAQGQLVVQQPLPQPLPQNLNLSMLPPGIYRILLRNVQGQVLGRGSLVRKP
jgi:hypothetical protein